MVLLRRHRTANRSACAPPGPPAQTAAPPLPRSIWDDGTANPEPALDQFTLVSKYQALGWLLGGLSIFAGLGTWAVSAAPEKRVPWVSPSAAGWCRQGRRRWLDGAGAARCAAAVCPVHLCRDGRQQLCALHAAQVAAMRPQP